MDTQIQTKEIQLQLNITITHCTTTAIVVPDALMLLWSQHKKQKMQFNSYQNCGINFLHFETLLSLPLSMLYK